MIVGPYHTEIAAGVLLDVFHKSLVKVNVVLEPLDLLRCEIFVLVETDLFQDLAAAHHYLYLSPWWWNPCWCADDVVQLLDICVRALGMNDRGIADVFIGFDLPG